MAYDQQLLVRKATERWSHWATDPFECCALEFAKDLIKHQDDLQQEQGTYLSKPATRVLQVIKATFKSVPKGALKALAILKEEPEIFRITYGEDGTTVFVKLNRTALLQSKPGSSRVSNLALGAGSSGSTTASSEAEHHLPGAALARVLAKSQAEATAFELVVAQGLPYLEHYNNVELVTMAAVSAGALILQGDTRNRQLARHLVTNIFTASNETTAKYGLFRSTAHTLGVLYAIAGATLDGHKPPKEVDGEAYMPKVQQLLFQECPTYLETSVLPPSQAHPNGQPLVSILVHKLLGDALDRLAGRSTQKIAERMVKLGTHILTALQTPHCSMKRIKPWVSQLEPVLSAGALPALLVRGAQEIPFVYNTLTALGGTCRPEKRLQQAIDERVGQLMDALVRAVPSAAHLMVAPSWDGGAHDGGDGGAHSVAEDVPLEIHLLQQEEELAAGGPLRPIRVAACSHDEARALCAAACSMFPGNTSSTEVGSRLAAVLSVLVTPQHVREAAWATHGPYTMTLSAGGGPANKVQNYGVKTLKLPGWQAPTFRELVAKGPTAFEVLAHTQPEAMLRLRVSELAAAALTAAAAHDAGSLKPSQVMLCWPPSTHGSLLCQGVLSTPAAELLATTQQLMEAPGGLILIRRILMYLARTVDNDILRSLLLAANCAHLVQYMGAQVDVGHIVAHALPQSETSASGSTEEKEGLGAAWEASLARFNAMQASKAGTDAPGAAALPAGSGPTPAAAGGFVTSLASYNALLGATGASSSDEDEEVAPSSGGHREENTVVQQPSVQQRPAGVEPPGNLASAQHAPPAGAQVPATELVNALLSQLQQEGQLQQPGDKTPVPPGATAASILEAQQKLNAMLGAMQQKALPQPKQLQHQQGISGLLSTLQRMQHVEAGRQSPTKGQLQLQLPSEQATAQARATAAAAFASVPQLQPPQQAAGKSTVPAQAMLQQHGQVQTAAPAPAPPSLQPPAPEAAPPAQPEPHAGGQNLFSAYRQQTRQGAASPPPQTDPDLQQLLTLGIAAGLDTAALAALIQQYMASKKPVSAPGSPAPHGPGSNEPAGVPLPPQHAGQPAAQAGGMGHHGLPFDPMAHARRDRYGHPQGQFPAGLHPAPHPLPQPSRAMSPLHARPEGPMAAAAGAHGPHPPRLPFPGLFPPGMHFPGAAHLFAQQQAHAAGRPPPFQHPGMPHFAPPGYAAPPHAVVVPMRPPPEVVAAIYATQMAAASAQALRASPRRVSPTPGQGPNMAGAPALPLRVPSPVPDGSNPAAPPPHPLVPSPTRLAVPMAPSRYPVPDHRTAVGPARAATPPPAFPSLQDAIALVELAAARRAPSPPPGYAGNPAYPGQAQAAAPAAVAAALARMGSPPPGFPGSPHDQGPPGNAGLAVPRTVSPPSGLQGLHTQGETAAGQALSAAPAATAAVPRKVSPPPGFQDLLTQGGTAAGQAPAGAPAAMASPRTVSPPPGFPDLPQAPPGFANVPANVPQAQAMPGTRTEPPVVAPKAAAAPPGFAGAPARQPEVTPAPRHAVGPLSHLGDLCPNPPTLQAWAKVECKNPSLRAWVEGETPAAQQPSASQLAQLLSLRQQIHQYQRQQQEPLRNSFSFDKVAAEAGQPTPGNPWIAAKLSPATPVSDAVSKPPESLPAGPSRRRSSDSGGGRITLGVPKYVPPHARRTSAEHPDAPPAAAGSTAPQQQAPSQPDLKQPQPSGMSAHAAESLRAAQLSIIEEEARAAAAGGYAALSQAPTDIHQLPPAGAPPGSSRTHYTPAMLLQQVQAGQGPPRRGPLAANVNLVMDSELDGADSSAASSARVSFAGGSSISGGGATISSMDSTPRHTSSDGGVLPSAPSATGYGVAGATAHMGILQGLPAATQYHMGTQQVLDNNKQQPGPMTMSSASTLASGALSMNPAPAGQATLPLHHGTSVMPAYLLAGLKLGAPLGDGAAAAGLGAIARPKTPPPLRPTSSMSNNSAAAQELEALVQGMMP